MWLILCSQRALNRAEFASETPAQAVACVARLPSRRSSSLLTSAAPCAHRYQGAPPGSYVRFELSDVSSAAILCGIDIKLRFTRQIPPEWVQNFDPTRPVLIGGLAPHEQVSAPAG